MIMNCPVCGKLTCIHWPEHWVYRRGKTMYCSENCQFVAATKDLKLMNTVIRRRINNMARLKKDGTPAKKPGPKPNKDKAQEGTLADAMAGMKDAAETFFGKCEDMGLKVEAPAAPSVQKITLPAEYDGMVIREVEGLFGRYRYTDIGSAQYIDYENSEGLDTLSMTVDQWRKFREEQQKAARILGVEL